MLSPLAIPVAALAGQSADLVLGAALLALVVGSLLCLAAAEEGGEPAQHVLALALGGSLALGLAHALATLLLPLLARA